MDMRATYVGLSPIPVSLPTKHERGTPQIRLMTYWIENFKETSLAVRGALQSIEHFTWTKPFAVNLTALPIRFMRTGSGVSRELSVFAFQHSPCRIRA